MHTLTVSANLLAISEEFWNLIMGHFLRESRTAVSPAHTLSRTLGSHRWPWKQTKRNILSGLYEILQYILLTKMSESSYLGNNTINIYWSRYTVNECRYWKLPFWKQTSWNLIMGHLLREWRTVSSAHSLSRTLIPIAAHIGKQEGETISVGYCYIVRN